MYTRIIAEPVICELHTCELHRPYGFVALRGKMEYRYKLTAVRIRDGS